MSNQQHRVTVDAEIKTEVTCAQLMRIDLRGPVDSRVVASDTYRIDLCLTPRPRNARACFVNKWNPNRFERIGKVFLTPPNETIRMVSDGNASLTTVSCQIPRELLPLPADFDWDNRCLEAGLDIQDSSILNLMIRVGQEVRHPGMGTDVMVGLLVGQIAIEISRYCLGVHEQPITSGLSQWRLRLIDERLREIRPSPSLDELSALCRLSVRQLSRAFRISRGCSIGDYVAKHRMDHAKRMLLADDGVKSIALTLGFKSASSFCYAFRRSTGVTPREFLQRSPRNSNAAHQQQQTVH